MTNDSKGPVVDVKTTPVEAAVSEAKAAFAAGRLNDYPTMHASGAASVKVTIAAPEACIVG